MIDSMKCLVIAAGRGSRLVEEGDSKPLTPLLGLPIIERVMVSAERAGCGEFYVVTGYQGEKVRGFVDRMAVERGFKITHIINDEWEKGNGLSVLKAKGYLSEPFFLIMGDHLFDTSILTGLKDVDIRDDGIVLAVDMNRWNRLVDVEDATKVRVEGGKVVDIGKDIKDYNGFDTGIFLCTPSIFTAIERSIKEKGDTSLTGGVKVLSTEGRVSAFNIKDSFWIDIDDKTALKKAEAVLLEGLRKPSDGPVSRYINRPLSIRITRLLVGTQITPNHVSLFSFTLCLISAFFFSLPGYYGLLTGAILSQFASIIDGCDGEIARLKFVESDFGGWFDAVLDRYADAFLLFGLTWHVFSYGQSFAGLFVGFMAIIGSFMNSYTADKYDSIMKERFEKGMEIRIGRDVRILMISIGAILNLPFLTLLLIAVLMNVETIRRVIVCYTDE